jgi:hypothetical protein
VYCITMVCTSINILCIGVVSKNLKLANLNNRKIGTTWSGSLTSSSMNPETRGGRGNQERSDGGDEYSGMRAFLARALLWMRLTQCMLQLSSEPLWYSNFRL